MLLGGLSLFLVLSVGVVWLHEATAASSVVPAGSQPASVAASPHSGSSPQPPVMVSSTPLPQLTPGPSQVLTTFCDAINQQDLNTAWGQYAKVLQKERTVLPPPSTRITIVHCRVDQVSDMSATGFLLLKTVGPNGYTDDYERDFQFTLSVEDGAWKIAQIARCLADGCLPDTTSIVP